MEALENFLCRIFGVGDRSPKSTRQKIKERVKFLINPFRNFGVFPGFIRQSRAFGHLFVFADKYRNARWLRKNQRYALDEDVVLDRRDCEAVGRLRDDGFTYIEEVCEEVALEEIYSEACELLSVKKGVKFHPSGKVDVGSASHELSYGYKDDRKRYQISIMGAEMGRDSAIVRFFLSSRILHVASLHMGFVPKLNSVSLWLNTPTDMSHIEQRSQLWHFDTADYKMLKCYLYLDPCGELNGPFSYINGTNWGGARRAILARAGQFLSSQEMSRWVDKREWTQATGDAGTCFFAEVSGLHRGGHIQSGHRLLAVAEFAAHDPWVESYYSRDIPPAKIVTPSPVQATYLRINT